MVAVDKSGRNICWHNYIAGTVCALVFWSPGVRQHANCVLELCISALLDFEQGCLDTCRFQCLICLCFICLYLHLFSVSEHASHGKAL